MVECILEQNEEKQYIPSLRNLVDEECDYIEDKPLEEMIDDENIHGWLQHKINIVENRLSYVVTEILKVNKNAWKDILDSMYNLSKKMSNELSIVDFLLKQMRMANIVS